MASSSQKSAAKANLLGKRQSEEEGLDDIAKETVGGLDAVPKKTVFVANLPPETEISAIIDFFQDVGQVVRVQLIVDDWGEHVGCGFVEFASAKQANKALAKKKGKSLRKHKIFLHVANKGTRCLPSKYCIDHKVWYEQDYLQQQESLVIAKYETPPDSVFVKEAAVLFVANLSPQTTKISQIIDFFKGVGDVVNVRLIVNHECKHVGYGFVEFPSAHQAKWALENKNGEYLHDHKIFLMKGLHETPDFAEVVAIKNKTLVVANLSAVTTKISHIINFFKDVGQVVHVRLIVDQRCRLMGFGYVEFASAHEAEKALEKKKGKYLHNREIALRFAKTDEDPSRFKHCIDHKVWYEEYEAVEGLDDETPDLVEDVALSEKTVFVSFKKEALCTVLDITNFFQDVGEVVRIRQIVDHWGEHVGCWFVEFASANEAMKAAQAKKTNREILVKMAKIDRPYPFRLIWYKLAVKLWYEDKLRRDGFGLQSESKLKKDPTIFFSGMKITFSDQD